MHESYEILKENLDRLKSEYFQLSFNKKTLITYSVDNTTIRAVRGCKKYKPLSIFRSWAYTFLSDTINLDHLNLRHDFSAFRLLTLNSLNEYWTLEDGSKLPIHLSNKFIDLFLKFLPLWTELDKPTKEWIFTNTNVPLDQHSLGYLRKHNPNLGIPKTASMRHITDEAMYNKMQLEIKNLCRDIPPIIFDLLAWEKTHSSFELRELEQKKTSS